MVRDAVVWISDADLGVASRAELRRHDAGDDPRQVGLKRHHLATFWEKQALGEDFDCHFIGGTRGTGIESFITFARNRIETIAALVGGDVAERARQLGVAEFGREVYKPRYWDVFRYGGQAQREAVQDEVHGGPPQKDGGEDARRVGA